VQRYHCDDCQLEWTTKGHSHRVFYDYRKALESLTNVDRTVIVNGYTLDLFPASFGYLRPTQFKALADAQYEGTDPRFPTISFGPYERTRLDRDFIADLHKFLSALGPDLMFMLFCPHDNATLITDDHDESHGV
jgi:hypothetical protein